MRASALRHGVGLLIVGGCVLAGCGHGVPTVSNAVDPAVQLQLRNDVRALTAAFADHRHAQARAALADLDADVAAAYTAGKITDAKVAAIRAAAAKLAADLDRLRQRLSPTVTVTRTPAPAPAPKPAPGHGKHGKGGGKGGGDSGD
jgi:hypothetical protein